MKVLVAEYSLAFSATLLDAAGTQLEKCKDSFDARRTVLYLSLLASEICLKALLEHAGRPVPEIIRYQHRLADLLEETDKCEVEVQVGLGNGERSWIKATGIRALTLRVDGAVSTVGRFLTAESLGAAQYPNEVRYGDRVVHFPPEAAHQASGLLLDWAKKNWDSFRLP